VYHMCMSMCVCQCVSICIERERFKFFTNKLITNTSNKLYESK